jgi:single-strand DNA-binding protein
LTSSGLFCSAVGLLFTVASIHTTGGAEMRSNKTSSTKTADTTADRQSRGDSVNQVTLIGRLVATPELRETGSGKHVTTVRVATNGKTHAEFHDVVLWAQLADFATSYLGKGRLVYIEGRLQSRQWKATDGTTRRTVEIVANRLQALSSKSAEAAPAA